jgi:FdhE protein
MTPDPISARAARARVLAARYPAAAGVLTFYAKLAEYQSSLLDSAADTSPDEAALVAMVPPFLDWLSREAPARLAQSALDLRSAPGDWGGRLASAFTDEGSNVPEDAVAMFVAESIVQPWAEREAKMLAPQSVPGAQTPARCPACGCAPVAGVLREEGHGARRTLVCARCATEWSFRRVCCPACGEDDFDSLPVYTADPFEHVRVEACDRCRRYLKSVDLTRDGLAIPQVDDLASLPLDLWAREQGYVRVHANLLRT